MDSVLSTAEPAVESAPAGAVAGETANNDITPAENPAPVPAEGAAPKPAEAENGTKDIPADDDVPQIEIGDLKIPDGFQTDDKSAADFIEFARVNHLTKETAQGLVDMYAGRIAALRAETEDADRAIETRLGVIEKNWIAEARADAEYGGDKWEQSLNVIARGRDLIGGGKDGPLVKVLEQHGLGNHPEVLRAFYRMGRYGDMEDGASRMIGSGPSNSDKSWAARGKRMFGTGPGEK